MNRKKSFRLSDNSRALLLLWCVTGLSCLFIFRQFLFGNSLVVFEDAGSDTKQQYLMQYASIVNHLRNGNFSLWDLYNGFGTSMFSLNLTNVFLMLLYAVGCLRGPGYIPGAIVYLLIGQIFLAATFCWLFLGCFSLSRRSKVIASYIYGLNGYMLIWGQHYQFGAFVVFLPLLLFFLEQAVRRKKFSLRVPLLVAVMVCSSVYMSYMSLLCAGFYLLLRILLIDETMRRRIRQLFMHCASLVLGIGIGSFIFLPTACYLLTVSSRMESDAPFLSRMLGYLKPFSASFYRTAFLRLFSTAFEGIRDYRGAANFYEAPVLFFSALFVILALQYVLTIHRQSCSRKQKAVQYAALVLGVFFFGIQLGACAFNAFAYPFSRHTFIFMPFFALITAFMLDRIVLERKLSIPALLAAVPVIGIGHFLAFTRAAQQPLQTGAVLSCLGAYGMLLLLFLSQLRPQERNFSPAASASRKSKTSARLVSLLLLVLCAVNVTTEGWLCYNDRTLLTKEDPQYWGGLYDPEVTQALDYLKNSDPSLYRVEKDYYSGSYCMDGLAQYYRGISTYNSTPNRNLEEFITLVIPNFPLMAAHEYSYRQIGWYSGHASLFGIKYLLSKSSGPVPDGFVLEKQFGSISVYRNQNTDSLVRFYTRTGDSKVLEDAYGQTDLERMLLEVLLLDKSDLEAAQASASDTLPLSSESLTGQYALEEVPVAFADIRADGSSDSVSIPIDQEATADYKRLYLEFDICTDQLSDLTVNQEEPFEYHFRVQGQDTQHIQVAVPKHRDTVILSCYAKNLQGAITNIRLLGSKEEITPCTDAAITLPDTSNDSCISGTIQTDRSGFLLLPVPFEEGWTAETDGEPAEILRADRGFMCIRIDAGEHAFTFTYTQPYLKEGILISLASLGLFAVLALIRGRRIRSRAQ